MLGKYFIKFSSDKNTTYVYNSNINDTLVLDALTYITYISENNTNNIIDFREIALNKT